MKIIIAKSVKYGNKEVFVDDEDFDRLSEFNWTATKRRNTFYAFRRTTAYDKAAKERYGE